MQTFCQICFLLCFQVIGAAVCGLLLWLRLDFWTDEYTNLSSKLNHFLILIYISLVLSVIITVFSICGLIGGCLKVKWMLGTVSCHC